MLTDCLEFRVYIPDAQGNIVPERKKRICNSGMRYELVSPMIKYNIVACYATVDTVQMV
jgi:hypothetical protein